MLIGCIVQLLDMHNLDAQVADLSVSLTNIADLSVHRRRC
jgi:hypothetical protein